MGIELRTYQVVTGGGNNIVPTATIDLQIGDKLLRETANGVGPVNAAYKAIDVITKIPTRLISYELRAGQNGSEAIGKTTIIVEFEGHKYTGVGQSADIIESAILAYIHALNQICGHIPRHEDTLIP